MQGKFLALGILVAVVVFGHSRVMADGLVLSADDAGLDLLAELESLQLDVELGDTEALVTEVRRYALPSMNAAGAIKLTYYKSLAGSGSSIVSFDVAGDSIFRAAIVPWGWAAALLGAVLMVFSGVAARQATP